MSDDDTILIREATPDDRAAIRAMTLAAYEQYEHLMSPAHWQEYHELLLAKLASDDAPFIVAELNGAIVGSVRLVPPIPADAPDQQPGDEWPEVSILAVSPAARGRGIASALLEECIRRARASGATTLGIHTEEVMSVALNLYQRRGFVRAPETDFYPDPDTHVMGFRLDLDEGEA